MSVKEDLEGHLEVHAELEPAMTEPAEPSETEANIEKLLAEMRGKVESADQEQGQQPRWLLSMSTAKADTNFFLVKEPAMLALFESYGALDAYYETEAVTDPTDEDTDYIEFERPGNNGGVFKIRTTKYTPKPDSGKRPHETITLTYRATF